MKLTYFKKKTTKIDKSNQNDILDPPVNPPWIVIREETEKSYNKELDKYLKLGYTIYSTHVKEAFNLYTAMLVRLG